MRRFEAYYEATNQFIGQGAFAQVFLAKRRSSGEEVAVKITSKTSAISQTEREILTQLSKLSHPQVVNIIDIFDQGAQMYIVQEYCVGGTLYDQMVKFQSLPEESCVEIILQVAKGLDFLHSINIVHRDIKPENVLKQIGKDGKETYKITDFGLSSNREKLMTSKIGTAYYVAPEILDGRAEREGGYDKSVDVWALGLMFDEMLHGTPFYNGSTEEEVFQKVRNEPYYIRADKYRSASFFETAKFTVQQVLINTIHRDPAKRKELSWVIDQLVPYVQQQRKLTPAIDTRKTNKQLFTEDKSPVAEDLLEFLNGNFPHENEQKFQQADQLKLAPTSQKVQQIHQKYQNLQNQSKSSIWDQPDEEEKLGSPFCKEHRLPAQHRMPIKIDGVLQIVQACTKCIQILGVYENEVLQKCTEDALHFFLQKRFEYFYKSGEVLARAKSLTERLKLGELEVRSSGPLWQQYQTICERYETDARVIFANRVLALEKFKARNYTGEDPWIAECLVTRRNDENVFVQHMRATLAEFAEHAVEECRIVTEQQLALLLDNLRKKLEI